MEFCQSKNVGTLYKLQIKGMFTRNEIQVVTKILTDIILHWRKEFRYKWVRNPFSLKNGLKLIINK